MRFALHYVLPLLVTLSSASWNDTRPFAAISLFNNFSSIAVVDSCQAKCVVHFDAPVTYVWKSAVINTTIVALATVRVTIFPKYNKTRTFSLAENLDDIGYTAQDRGSGTVSTTLTYGTLKNADGEEATITEVIIYPNTPTASPGSYWWSGIRPTTTAGSSSCITQLSPATVQLPAHSHITRPTPASRNSSLDGTNYYLVSQPDPHAIQAMQANDSIVAECQRQSPTVTARLDEPMTTASFITVTVTRTETNCRPEFPCEVREEQTEIGGLMGPSGQPLPPAHQSPRPNAGAAAPARPQGAASPLRPHYKEIPGIHNQADKPKGVAGAMTAHPEKSATAFANGADTPATFESVRPEKPATSLIVPSRRPQAAGVDDTLPRFGPQTAQPMVTNGPPALGTVVIGGVTLPVSAVAPAPVTFGPHIEQPVLVAVGPKTMAMGAAGTYGDTIIAIKTAAGGATIAVIGNTQNGKWQTVALNGAGEASVGGGDTGAGRIFAPTPVALPQQQRHQVTVGDTTLTPAANGGYAVGESSLIPGGPAVTVYGSTSAGESSGSGSLGNKPSATVLSLTTNAAGAEVLIVNGKTTDLPIGPLETSKPKPAQYSGSDSDLFLMSAGTGIANTSATHKSSAFDRLSWAKERWSYGAAMYVMALIFW